MSNVFAINHPSQGAPPASERLFQSAGRKPRHLRGLGKRPARPGPNRPPLLDESLLGHLLGGYGHNAAHFGEAAIVKVGNKYRRGELRREDNRRVDEEREEAFRAVNMLLDSKSYGAVSMAVRIE